MDVQTVIDPYKLVSALQVSAQATGHLPAAESVLQLSHRSCTTGPCSRCLQGLVTGLWPSGSPVTIAFGKVRIDRLTKLDRRLLLLGFTASVCCIPCALNVLPLKAATCLVGEDLNN